MRPAILLAFPVAVAAVAAFADPPKIVAAEASRGADGTWRFSVTLAHPDTGWDHYADGWEVVGPGGERLGYRELLHPHVEEQPFTRSLGDVEIPAGVDRVVIRARDSAGVWSAGAPISLTP